MSTTAELLKTPLHDWHVAHGGRMVEFGGWSMPVQYTSISEEHAATRNAVGVFDISHMGRLQFFSNEAADFLDSVATRRVTDLKPNQVRYSLICNGEGGILDDVLIYGGIPNGSRPYSMVVNASNRDKIVAWLKSQVPRWLEHRNGAQISIGDDTMRSAMIAVQGPKTLDVLTSIVQIPGAVPSSELRAMRYYQCAVGSIDGVGVLVSRTGYTGEDGYELICDNEVAADIWQRIVDAIAVIGGMAAGLGARDTLRLEAAMPLYGHELSESINPIQAGLAFAVNLKDRDFVGRAALEKFAADKSQPVRIGLQLDGKRVLREGYAVLQGDEVVGEVTSGTFSPTFERPIAMAYVRPTASAVGTRLAIDIRSTHHPAVVVQLPFYEREKVKS